MGRPGRCCRCVPAPLRNFFLSSHEEYRLLKFLLGFPFGALLGIGLYYCVLEGMSFPEVVQYSLAGLFMTSLALGFSLAVQVRCIAFLTVPTFFGKTGRGYVGAFALTYLLMGPVANITLNAWEVTRSVACSVQVSANLSKARLDLRMRPLENVMRDLKNQSEHIHEITSEVKTMFSPVAFEVEDPEEIERLKLETMYMDYSLDADGSRSDAIEARHDERGMTKDQVAQDEYEKKLDYRCEDIYNMAVQECRDAFQNLRDDCWAAFPGWLPDGIRRAFCWPFRLDGVCELVRTFSFTTDDTCDSMDSVNEGFGEAFSTADEAADAFGTNFDVNVQYQVVTVEEELDKKTAQDVALAIQHEFEATMSWTMTGMSVVRIFTAFLFLWVLASSKKYHEKYLTDFSHDNCYITDYFHHIEERRKLQGKPLLIPLRKFERTSVYSAMKISMSKEEKKKLISTTVKLLMRAAMFGLILLVDQMIHDVLDIIRRHSYIEFRQAGEHHITLEVYGGGAMADLIYSLLKGFNSHHTLTQISNNQECLPVPTQLASHYPARIMGSLAVVWILMLLQSYALRLRRIIAAFFYPKREKKRILFLYNNLLKKRHGFLRHARHHIRTAAKELRLHNHVALIPALRRQFPRLCAPLRWLGLGRRSCLFCEEQEGKKLRLVECPTKGCNFAYCVECWSDIEENCYACRRYEDWDSDTSWSDWSKKSDSD